MAQTPKKTEESVKQRVYRTLRGDIMSGIVEPGRPITILGVAEKLGVSPMPVREALHRLVADGALEYLDNRRVRVPAMTAAKFDEILATRIALETLAAERALPFIDSTRLARLQTIDMELEAAYAAEELEKAIALNFSFHRCIYEASGQGVLLDLLESVWLRLGPFMRAATANLAESYRVDRHAEAMQAIDAKNADALRAAITADIQDGVGHLGRSFLSGNSS
ncbi:GntR family transcriptional regulator [Rhizobium oryzicola]|uniref:GntR family transcriptional regulator n=1 Tax=Rhizobium oryzicola TaxID=1232668 RepID=A0ABT8T4M5_9HYPH|nr:GntR family transcriptional regulator [Rhizobium oryzicola]MDO1584857.1 GntR family transcriptional regulator [Rhizobium oryzicola]